MGPGEGNVLVPCVKEKGEINDGLAYVKEDRVAPEDKQEVEWLVKGRSPEEGMLG